MLWEQYEDLCITTALLMGGEPVYDDFGHPERAKARMYWSISTTNGAVYGYTRAEACRKWLLKKGIKINHRTGEITKCDPHHHRPYWEK